MDSRIYLSLSLDLQYVRMTTLRLIDCLKRHVLSRCSWPAYRLIRPLHVMG